MANDSASWKTLEKLLNEAIISVIENEFKFKSMTPVQVFEPNVYFIKQNHNEF